HFFSIERHQLDREVFLRPEEREQAEHGRGLRASAEAVGIPYTWTNEELITATYELLEKNNLQDAYIRPLVFCPPNMSLQKAKSSGILLAVWNWGAYLGDTLLKVGLSGYQRPNPGAFKMQAKVCGHYVNSIMACQEAKDNGYDEALLTDSQGFVAEGPGANVFYEKDGKLFTPAAGNILTGITRATVLELCTELGIEADEKQITVEELKEADTVFYCGTAAEVIGWESLDGQPFKKEWKDTVSKKIQEAYKKRVLEIELEPVLA
ncbi:MAG: branched-chain amino acid aminotransferase, partial [Sphingobacteriales bacterium]